VDKCQNLRIKSPNSLYVNYCIGDALLCFEVGGERTDLGTVVLNVEDFSNLRTQLQESDVKVVGGNAQYFKIKDPDGRSLILEPVR
jgi:hypothetical protein